MEVNWLTVLNTVLNVEVWIKGTWRAGEESGWVVSLCFFFFSSIKHQVCTIVIYQPVCFLPVEILTRIFLLSSFLSSPLSAFYSFSPPSYFSCHIPSHPFCCLPGFIRQQWGWKLHFSWNVSCCKAPAGVIFFSFFFFCKGENIRMHLLHFMYVNQNGDAHLPRPARWCV